MSEKVILGWDVNPPPPTHPPPKKQQQTNKHPNIYATNYARNFAKFWIWIKIRLTCPYTIYHKRLVVLYRLTPHSPSDNLICNMFWKTHLNYTMEFKTTVKLYTFFIILFRFQTDTAFIIYTVVPSDCWHLERTITHDAQQMSQDNRTIIKGAKCHDTRNIKEENDNARFFQEISQ